MDDDDICGVENEVLRDKLLLVAFDNVFSHFQRKLNFHFLAISRLSVLRWKIQNLQWFYNNNSVAAVGFIYIYGLQTERICRKPKKKIESIRFLFSVADHLQNAFHFYTSLILYFANSISIEAVASNNNSKRIAFYCV